MNRRTGLYLFHSLRKARGRASSVAWLEESADTIEIRVADFSSIDLQRPWQVSASEFGCSVM